MKLCVNLSFLGLILLSISCSTSTDFDRDNKNDPSSKNFTPRIHAFQASLNNDKTVSLSWNDNSNFEDGFIIGKSFGVNSDIQILDTLPPNSTSYSDDSGLLAELTNYHLTSFKEGATSKDTLSFKKAELQFGEIENIDHTVNNSNGIE